MMVLDSLVRAIGAADSSALRDIAHLCLIKRGFKPSLADGPHDGGADFLIYVRPPNTAKFAVQISVEKDWQKKLRADAPKARQKLGVNDLLFITTRVVTEPKFQEIADDLRSTINVQSHKMDAKSIASLAKECGFTEEILGRLGIPVSPPAPRPFQRPNLREDVAYACAFFGTDAQAFRKTVLEHAVLAAVFHAGGSAQRDVAVNQAALSLGLASNQRAQVTSALDRMLGDGRLTGKNGTIALDALAMDNWSSVHALQERGRADLGARVDGLLAPHVKSEAARRDAVEAVLEDLGALLLDAGKGQREGLLRDLSALASGSPFGRALVAGEVFINLVSLKTPHLFRAFGGGKELWAVFDTSVAMPLLCSLLHGAAEQDLFVAAEHAYNQLTPHGGTMVLPTDYLEEVASHLLNAYLHYRDIVDLDSDLRGSKNAFVAHYVALRDAAGDGAGPYVAYLEGFGITEAIARAGGDVARDALMRKLQGLFKRYNIEVQPLSPTASSRKRAQMALSFAMRERDDDGREPVLVRHDTNTLGWLFDHASNPDAAYVFCTWDKLHPYVRARETADWDVLDPVALGDVLSLAAPGSEEVTIVSPVVVALTLSAEAEKSGAAVWDRLVTLEKEKLHDARLLAAARAFKQDWMNASAKDKRSLDLQDAWEQWKESHLNKP